MLNPFKLARENEKLRSEIAALHAIVQAQAARTEAVEQAVSAIRDAMDQLQNAREGADSRFTELVDRIENLRGMWDDADERVQIELGTNRNRLLKLEKRIDQQTEELQSAVAGLITRIERVTDRKIREG